MATQDDIWAVVNRWRTNVKKKFRGIASFEERAQLRFNALKERIYPKRVRMDRWRVRQATYRGWGDYAWTDRTWKPIRVGGAWGGEDATAFFRQRIVVPPDFAGERIALQIFLGGDSLVTLNGKPHHGLDIFRNEMPLVDRARAGQVLKVEIESYMNFQGVSAKTNEIIASDLVSIDTDLRDAYWDLWCVSKLLQIQDIDVRLKEYVEYHLWEALRLIPLQENDPSAFRRCAMQARASIRETVYRTDRFKGDGTMYMVGHSHLDLVYLWPYKEFIRKVGRTHATMLRLLEEYPDWVFSQSQAKIYADMKRYFPALFRQVRERVREGRWEPLGAFWVEPDCNVISGESFVRQILHGQRFLRENFGMTSRSCWQPDVFGLSWAMPQILTRSGLRYFVTNKLQPWNDTNPWTLNTFWWEGFDGTRVLAIVPPGHFIGTVDPDVLDLQWKRFADKAEVGRTLHVYGWGDGGGGVDPEMIESARRYRDLPGLVRTEFAKAETAFDRIAERARGARLPVHRDEIYLEAHRGTYTHKGRLKKLNRRAEILYREAEMLAAFAWVKTGRYPEAALDAGWKDLLTAQFHDALPGTHVAPVYAQVLADYGRIEATGRAVRERAMAALAGRRAKGRPAVLGVLNSHLHPREEYASVPDPLVAGRVITDAGGAILPQQTVVDLDGAVRRVFRTPRIEGTGFRRLRVRDATGRPVPRGRVKASDRTLENECLRARFSARGELTSLWDKERRREIVAPGARGNVFQLFEDTPGRYDAWDIVETYQDHPIPLTGAVRLRVDECGPVRASLRLETLIGASRLVQRISLLSGSRQLTFETRIDWVERQRLLKVAFPVDVNAAYATHDIAFGNMPRPTHTNTSFDRARFEVPTHQWVDLSQHDHGVSLLNDCKYGCDVRGRVLRLTLLKGSIHPDPKADMETHTLTYALYPHAGDWRGGGTLREAAALNAPLFVWPLGPREAGLSDGQVLIAGGAPNLTLEAVKRSEDGTALVVRLVERHNAATEAALDFGRPVRRAWSCNLMETTERPLKTAGSKVTFRCRPHEFVTLKIEFGTATSSGRRR